MKFRCSFLTLIVILAILNVTDALACICNVPPPPCVQYWRNDTVFVGTVTEVYRDDSSPIEKVRIQVEENFRSMEFPLAETYNYGHSCAYTYNVGDKFLFYGQLDEKVPNRFATGLCNRTASYNEDLVDLEFLRALREGKETYWIWGTISGYGYDVPQKGIRAEVLGQNRKLEGISDESGNIKIDVQRAGKYKVRVHLPKGTTDVNGGGRNEIQLSIENRKQVVGGRIHGPRPYIDYELEVKPNRCGWFDVSIPSS